MDWSRPGPTTRSVGSVVQIECARPKGRERRDRERGKEGKKEGRRGAVAVLTVGGGGRIGLEREERGRVAGCSFYWRATASF